MFFLKKVSKYVLSIHHHPHYLIFLIEHKNSFWPKRKNIQQKQPKNKQAELHILFALLLL